MATRMGGVVWARAVNGTKARAASSAGALSLGPSRVIMLD